MKQYKIIDYWLQILIFSTGVLYIVFIDVDSLIFWYLFLGGWQLLSCVIHGTSAGHFYRVNDRSYYLKTLLWVLITGILLIPVWILFFFMLLFVSPVLAIWYISICHAENKLLSHKTLVHLK